MWTGIERGVSQEMSSGGFAVRGIWKGGVATEARSVAVSYWEVMSIEERDIETVSRLRMLQRPIAFQAPRNRLSSLSGFTPMMAPASKPTRPSSRSHTSPC